MSRWLTVCPLAPQLERTYGGQVNFVAINGDDPKNANVVSFFGVDSIPHLSLFDGERALQNTLIGAVPAPLLEREILKLLGGGGG